MGKEQVQFVVGFSLLIVIILALVILTPHPALPEKSQYMTEEQELEELRDGKIVLIFFYNEESPLSESQGELINEISQKNEDLIIQWINRNEYEADPRVRELINQYNVEATPVIVIKNLHHDKKIIGRVERNEIQTEINRLRTG